MTWKDWVKDSFNVLFLGTLFVFTVVITLHAIHHNADAGSITWLEGIAGQFMAALIGLMTGSKITAKREEK